MGIHDKTQRIVCLNESGCYIWRSLDDGVQVAEIVYQLSQQPRGAVAAIESDVEQILASKAALDNSPKTTTSLPESAAWSRSVSVQVPAAGASLHTSYFQIGRTLIAIQSALAIYYELILPLFGHLIQPVQPRVNLFIRLGNDGQVFSLTMGDKLFQFSTIDALAEKKKSEE